MPIVDYFFRHQNSITLHHNAYLYVYPFITHLFQSRCVPTRIYTISGHLEDDTDEEASSYNPRDFIRTRKGTSMYYEIA